MHHTGPCPLSQRQVIDEYFIEHRTKILDIAAFLDRFDRAGVTDAEGDFRMLAFHQALQALVVHKFASRMHDVQILLSDPRTDLLAQLDRKSASGAYEAC